MRRLLRPLLVLLAILFLVEAWLWRHLQPIVAWIVARLPFKALKARLAAAILSLPPALTLIVFIVPVGLLVPFKLGGLWLLAQKQWFAAGVVLLMAKLVGVAVTAFLFEVTRPKLLQMAWFRWLYERVMVWLAWAHAITDPIKMQVRAILVQYRSRLASALQSDGDAGFIGRLIRLRRHIQGLRHPARRPYPPPPAPGSSTPA